MNDFEWLMLSYYAIYLKMSEKIMQQIDKEALNKTEHVGIYCDNTNITVSICWLLPI